VIDDALGDEVRVTVIAAGFDRAEQVEQPVGAQPGQRAGLDVGPAVERDRAGAGEGPKRTWSSPVRPIGRDRGDDPVRSGDRGNSRQRPDDDDDLDIPSFLKR
jgi:cell division protein FtsZ